MNEIVNTQALLFVVSIQIGIMMGAIYDLLRIFRKLIKHPNFLVQIEDMLYWLCCGLAGFYRLYTCNYAAIRPYIFIGIIMGGILYFLTFSIIFMKIMTRIVNLIRTTLRKIYTAILRPLRKIVRLIRLPFNYLKVQNEKRRYHLKMKKRAILRAKYQLDADKKTELMLKK